MNRRKILENVYILIDVYRNTTKSYMMKNISSISNDYLYDYYIVLCNLGIIGICDLIIEDGRIFDTKI